VSFILFRFYHVAIVTSLFVFWLGGYDISLLELRDSRQYIKQVRISEFRTGFRGLLTVHGRASKHCVLLNYCGYIVLRVSFVSGHGISFTLVVYDKSILVASANRRTIVLGRFVYQCEK
jgi:hypothetical protein